jgi:formylglycine-generating enzyme required for sulfatase activity
MKGISVHIFLFILFLVGNACELPDILPDNLSLQSENKDRVTTEYLREPDGMIVVHIPPGEFYAGSEKPLHYEHEKPSLNLRMSHFLIDKFEISVEQYQLCVKAGKCQKPLVSAPETFPLTAELPVTGVSYEQALSYCGWVKMQLPTEAQWEFAAKGRYSTVYPWGSNLHERQTGQPIMDRIRPVAGNPPAPAPVSTLDNPSTESSFGIFHLAGNVSEWTMDDADIDKKGNLQPRALSEDQERNRRDKDYKNTGDSPHKIIKGASYLSVFPVFQRASYRSYAPKNSGSNFIGFRCGLELH